MYRNDASNPAVFDDEVVRRNGCNPVCEAFAYRMFVESIPQTTATAGRSLPAYHTITFLLIKTVPLHSSVNHPLVNICIRLFSIESRPRLVCRTLTECNPVIKGQVRCVFVAML